MRVRTPDYYKEFKCVDKMCTDTCCAGWEVDLDEASRQYYEGVEGEFGERLRKVMVFEEGEHRFKLCANGRCPFLNDENLCDLYIALGEDKLCTTCEEHPRYWNDFGDLREKGISISCPESARIILSKRTAVTYDTEITDQEISDYSNLDPQKYMLLVTARKKAYEEAQNAERDICSRIKTILKNGIECQKQLSKKKVNEKAEIYTGKQETMLAFLKHIQNYECINPNWNLLLQETICCLQDENMDYEALHRSFEEDNWDEMYQYEQLVMYFLYRYYLSSVYDYDLLSKLKLLVFGVLICKEMGVAVWKKNHKLTLQDQIEIIHCFSRQFEHSDANVEAINKSFCNERLFDINQFIEIL